MQTDYKNLFKEADQFIQPLQGKERPIIGLSSNRREGTSCIAEAYFRAVLKAGGVPVLIPVMTDVEALSTLVEGIDGLILSGGGDINPLFLNEEPIPALGDGDSVRDTYDFLLLRLALNRGLPVFGICRGHQILNVAMGGTLFQDIYSQSPDSLIRHSQQFPKDQPSHTVRLTTDLTRLSDLFEGKKVVAVNSIHHQAVKEVAPEFIESAIAPDGINEAIEHPEYPLLGVQWHPEILAVAGQEEMIQLFKYHVASATIFKQAKAIHRRILTVDSHVDTPMLFTGSFDIGQKEGGKVNLPFMEEGLLDAVFMVAYIPQGKRDEESLNEATAYAMNRLTEVKRQAVVHSDRVGIATSPEELMALKLAGKKALLLGVENGYAVGKDLANLTHFQKMGVSYITLCHNGANDICDSAKGEAEWGGLSPFGREVVEEMNRLGMMIDISHAAESTFYDVLKYSKQPFIASHSSVRALVDHPRNLTDDQIKAIASVEGVVQVCLYKYFINAEGEKASLSDAIRHIEHIVNLVGLDYVGIGSDFDGDGELIGCRAANELIHITTRLLAMGWSEDNLRKLWGGNLLRVMDAVRRS